MNPLSWNTSVFEGTAEMQETSEERESRMRDLAQKLMFTVETTNGRFKPAAPLFQLRGKFWPLQLRLRPLGDYEIEMISSS
jgi:hypothetical protein